MSVTGHGNFTSYEDVVADLGMRLDDLEFRCRKYARAAQDLGRHVDLADVVDGGAEAQAFEAILRQIQFPADGHAQLRHAQLVARGVWIALLHRERAEQIWRETAGV
jgi:hypothetical protein